MHSNVNLTMIIKYLALGDSYTIGERVEIKDRWPNQLQSSLIKNEIEIVGLKIVAKKGWTTSDLISGISKDIFDPPYDLVSLLIGVNNQYENEDKKKYRSELTELIYLAIDFAGGDTEKVFVVSIPDWSSVPFAKGRDRDHIAKEIAIFNTIKLEECNKIGVRFIDITPLSKTTSKDSELIVEDGLHPSGKMYKLWVKKILPIVIDMLIID